MTGTAWCRLSESKWELQQAHAFRDGAVALFLLVPGIVGFVFVATMAAAAEFWCDRVAALFFVAFLLLISGTFSWCGLWFMFGRCGAMIDKSEQRVISWWSLLWLRREQSVELRSFNTVEVEAHPSKGQPAYKILLTDCNSWKLVRVVRECDVTTAKRLAMELAQFLELPCKF